VPWIDRYVNTANLKEMSSGTTQPVNADERESNIHIYMHVRILYNVSH